MCRILFATGEGERIRPLLDALVNASMKDPYKEARGRESQHKDGWGYLLIKGKTERYYRSVNPIFHDIDEIQNLNEKLNGFVVLMVHARAASQGSIGLLNTHPFAFSSRRGFSFWLLHNGDLDKKRLIEIAGFEMGDLAEVSDSYTLAAYLCRHLKSTSKGDVFKAYREAVEATRTSFNTATVFQDTTPELRAFITAYSTEKRAEDPKDWDYVKLLALEEEDLLAVASSTVG
ncbi:class II glutamine amidotransferase, partial [Thermococcus sp.]|uniref:class II glutamine amidotransferase n=1 Tax=Thermococcus sp. TaxID=35749 RepID=UPI0025F0781D